LWLWATAACLAVLLLRARLEWMPHRGDDAPVYVCVCGREREREMQRVFVQGRVWPFLCRELVRMVQPAARSSCVCVCVCERERHKETERGNVCGGV